MSTKTQTKPKLSPVKTKLRRGALAYVGLYDFAFDRAKIRVEKTRNATEDFMQSLIKKGESLEANGLSRVKSARSDLNTHVEDLSSKLKAFSPKRKDVIVEELEDEVAKLAKKLNALKSTAKTKITETATQTAKATAEAVSDAADAVAKTADKVTDELDTRAKAAPKATKAPQTKTATSTKKQEPRHIPYFNDVKRYDPLAKEDIVRKIVNHCGIALQSEDARYVACTDESERDTVRESWLKRKLGLTATDAELNKKVLNVCSIMQRDNRKNRVTFYYLLAKAERKLDTL